MQLSLKRDQLDGLDLYTYDHSVRDDVIRKNPDPQNKRVRNKRKIRGFQKSIQASARKPCAAEGKGGSPDDHSRG